MFFGLRATAALSETTPFKNVTLTNSFTLYLAQEFLKNFQRIKSIFNLFCRPLFSANQSGSPFSPFSTLLPP